MKANRTILLGWIETIKERVANKLDAIIIVEGDEGSGKSSLAVWVGFLIDKNFNLDNVIYSMDRAVDLIYSLPPGSVIVWDEACYDMSKRDAMTKTNKEIIKLAMATRSRRLIHMVCIPHIQDLENYISDRRACYTLSVFMRGDYRGFFKLKYPKRWYDKSNNIHTKWRPLYRRTLTFKQLPNSVDEEYNKRKELYSRAKMERIAGKEEEGDKLEWRMKQYHELKQQGKRDKEIAEVWGITPAAVCIWKKSRGLIN